MDPHASQPPQDGIVVISGKKQPFYSRNKVVIPTVIAVLFAIVGIKLLFQSGASPVFSTHPNDVVIEYRLPHLDLKPSENLLMTMYQPFTLYGDGSLFCGQQAHEQFSAPRSHTSDTMHHSDQVPTHRKLSGDEMNNLVQQIRETGFTELDPEYYTAPVAQQQHVIRLVAYEQDKFVYYYNDTTPPAAYTKTLQILQAACSQTTQPYTANTVVLSSRASADTHGKQANPNSDTSPAKENIDKVLRASKSRKEDNDSRRASQKPIEEGENYIEIVTGQAAKDLQSFSKGQNRLFLSDGGVNYEVGIDPQLPEVRNPLDVDIREVRAKVEQKKAEKKVSFIDRLFSTQKAAAFAVPDVEAYRIVYFYPSDGNNDAQLDYTRAEGRRIHDWYCNKVGRCPDYNGVITSIKGSRTKAWYENCHATTCGSGELWNVFVNAFDADPALIKPGVITVLVPAWPVSTNQACGWGMVGGNSAIFDVYDAGCRSIAAGAHEFGHNLGFSHVCSDYNLMVSGCSANYCDIGGSRPVCRLTSTQITKLRNDYAHFPVASSVVSGRVHDSVTGKGLRGVKINICVANPANYDNGSYVTTDANGKWSIRLSVGTAFCAKIGSTLPADLLGPTLNNTAEHAASKTYEYQVSGKNCYKNSNCSSVQQTWDRSDDGGYDFAYKITGSSLYFVQTKNTAGNKVELQRATSVSNYATLESKVATAFTTTDAANGTFQIVNEDLYFIQTRNTSSGFVEVKVATKASNYGSVTTYKTSKSTSDVDTTKFQVRLSPSLDLYVVRTVNAGENGNIQVSQYKKSYNYTTGTNLGAGPVAETQVSSGVIDFADNTKIVQLKTKGTETGFVTLHVYRSAGTDKWTGEIHEPLYFSSTYAADLALAFEDLVPKTSVYEPSGDVVAIRTKNTTSGKVELMFDVGPNFGNRDRLLVTPFSTTGSENGLWMVSR